MVLLFLAGLQSLPQEPLEAAAVDGASEWNIFWWIVLPLMRPIIMIALMLRITDTFRTFDVVWLMTQGGPGGATNLITVNAYLLAFQAIDFGHAAAVSYIALFISLLLLGIALRRAVVARGERMVSDQALQPPLVAVVRGPHGGGVSRLASSCATRRSSGRSSSRSFRSRGS